jgi:hypothetical protein
MAACVAPITTAANQATPNTSGHTLSDRNNQNGRCCRIPFSSGRAVMLAIASNSRLVIDK